MSRVHTCATHVLVVAAAALANACGAVYPAIETPVRVAPSDAVLDPAPPASLHYLAITTGRVPRLTRGGKPWDELGERAPDPYLKVFLDNELLFTTSVERDAYEPKWPDAPRKNWSMEPNATLKVELWNANPINDQPICIQEVPDVVEQAAEGELTVECEGGAGVDFEFRAARPKFGLGFRYEIRQEGAAIRDVVDDSPASRAQLAPGDFISAINGQSTRGMSAGQLQSLVNVHARNGLKLTLRREGASSRQVEIKEGPIYSLPLN
jgi:hypothetical protein